MKKSVLIAFALCAWILVGCGDSKGESSVNLESNAKDSAVNSNNLSTKNAQDSTKNSADLGTNQSANLKNSSVDSAQVSPQTATNLPATKPKNPQDLYKKCIACHGARGDKVAPGSAGSILIADLSKQILIDDLKGYRAKTLSRGGTAAIMYLQANGLSDEDIEILAEYISNFKK